MKISETTVLDGRTGKPLLSRPIRMVVGTQTSPLTISVNGVGNDIFLYWVSDCHGSPNKTNLEFDFQKGTSVHEQSRADFCKIRFKEKLFTKMYALSNHISAPGVVIYDSDLRKATEYSNPINYSALGLEFLYRHPGYQEDYRMYSDENIGLVNNILPQEFADLPNQYDDIQLEKMLNRQTSGRKYSDLGQYNLPDYQNDGPYYPSYYMQQSNSGNEGYYSPNYQPSTYRIVKKPVATNSWPKSYLPTMQHYLPHGPFNDRMKRSFPKVTTNRRVVRQKPLYHTGSKKSRRHVGPHDGGGVQRVISTGTLAPSLPASKKDGLDIVFATFWFYPSEIQGLLPEDKECIRLRMEDEKERFDPSSTLYGMDHDAYEEMVTEECLKRSGHLKFQSKNKSKLYNPFNRPMGQMTVYRIHVNCICPQINKTSGFKCATILPFEDQMWTSYLGLYGNSVARPRQHCS